MRSKARVKRVMEVTLGKGARMISVKISLFLIKRRK